MPQRSNSVLRSGSALSSTRKGGRSMASPINTPPRKLRLLIRVPLFATRSNNLEDNAKSGPAANAPLPVRMLSDVFKGSADRADHLEHRGTLEIAWSEISVIGRAGWTKPHLVRQDRISDQRKRVCQQAATDEPRSAFCDRVRRRLQTRLRWEPKQVSSERPGVRQVIFATDSA